MSQVAIKHKSEQQKNIEEMQAFAERLRTDKQLAEEMLVGAGIMKRSRKTGKLQVTKFYKPLFKAA